MKSYTVKNITALLFLISFTQGLSAMDKNTVSGSIQFCDAITANNIQRVVVQLLDVSRADTSSIIINELTLESIKSVPIKYSLHYDSKDINPKNRYTIAVSVYQKDTNGKVDRTYLTTQSYPVITHGFKNKMDVVVTRIKQ